MRRLEEAHSRHRGFDDADSHRRHADAAHEEREAQGGRTRQRGQKHRDEKGRKQLELERRAVVDERKIRPGVVKDHRLVDHRQFQMRFRVIERHTAAFGKENREEGEAREEERRGMMRPDARRIAGQQVGEGIAARQKDEKAEQDEDRRFDERGELDFAARAHALKGAPRVERAEHREEASRTEQVEEDDGREGGEGRGGRVRCRIRFERPGEDERGKERRGERDGRREVEEPGRRRGARTRLAQELREVEVEAEKSRPAPSGEERLGLVDEAEEERREQERAKEVENVHGSDKRGGEEDEDGKQGEEDVEVERAVLQEMRALEEAGAPREDWSPEVGKRPVVRLRHERGVRRRGGMPLKRNEVMARLEEWREEVDERLGERRRRVGHARGRGVIAAVPGRADGLDAPARTEEAADGDERDDEENERDRQSDDGEDRREQGVRHGGDTERGRKESCADDGADGQCERAEEESERREPHARGRLDGAGGGLRARFAEEGRADCLCVGGGGEAARQREGDDHEETGGHEGGNMRTNRVEGREVDEEFA